MARGGLARRSSRRVPARRDDPHVGPSAEWGWHGSFPHGVRIAGAVSVLILVTFLLTTRDFYEGITAALWLGGVALVILIGILRRRRRR